MGRSKCVRTSSTPKKVMSYSEFNNRIRKTFYYGGSNLCENEDMEVSRPLAEYASDLFSEPHKGHSLNRLSTIAASSVHATPCSLIMALIYLDRLNITDPCYARRITPQELFIVSMMISTKFYAGHDEEIFMSDWAEDGNMTEERLKQLELEFLSAIEWNIYISNEQFYKKLATIEKTIARREGIRRGWLTYTELTQLLPSFTLAKFLFNNFALLAMSYAASVMTLAGALYLASQIPRPTLLTKTEITHIGNTTSSTMLNEINLIPSGSELLTVTILPTRASTCLNSTKDALYQEEHSTGMNSLSVTCMALNIDAELKVLEVQYKEEVRLAELRQRQHEIETESRLKLPGGALYSKSNINVERLSGLCKNRQQSNWRVLQEELSKEKDAVTDDDYMDGGLSLGNNLLVFTIENMPDLAVNNDQSCYNNWRNCSGSVLWHLLSEATQHSFVRTPLLWFKFM